jgi:uncharacterized protein YggE
MKQLQRITAISFAMFALISLVSAQERPAVPTQNNSVVVGSDGKFESAPDTAVLQFNIAAQENTSVEAYVHAAKAAERMRQALKANGVDPKLAELTQYSLQPMYDYKSPKRRVVGFRVTTSVTLKLKDFSKVGPLLTALSSIDETENQSINYTLENIDAAKTKAVEDAFRRARSLAEAIARESGRPLGQLNYASVDVMEEAPIPRPMVGMAGKMQTMRAEATPAPTEEFTPQKVTITAHVNAMFGLK